MKERIEVKNGPRPAGPYSPGVRANGMIFVAGQVPIDPATGELERGPIGDQVRRVLENHRLILEAAGSSMDKALKATVYLQDLENFEAMNQAYGEFFPGDCPPVRTTIQVARLPKDVGVEIDLIALE